ncbi:MAG TPA: HD domain-containing protein [Terriglobia bacterium]
MKERFVADFKPGAIVETTFLVQSKELKKGRSGGRLELRLQDSSGAITCHAWDAGGAEFDVDDVVQVKARVEDLQGAPLLRIETIRRHDGPVDLRDYLPRSSNDAESLYAFLLGRLRRIPQGPVRQLLLAVMEDPKIARRYKLAPAATRYHHAYLGGLLDHVTSLVKLGDRMADHYSALDRDLLLAGFVLHDLGKIEELYYEGAFRYSTRGQLLGHIVIGLEMVREKIDGIPGFPASLKNQIEHIILSHHGKLEFGSPKEPMFPEALVVHYLDDLDSKLESMRAQYEADRSRPGDWTTRNRALGRELLRAGPSQTGTHPEKEPDAALTPSPSDRPF